MPFANPESLYGIQKVEGELTIYNEWINSYQSCDASDKLSKAPALIIEDYNNIETFQVLQLDNQVSLDPHISSTSHPRHLDQQIEAAPSPLEIETSMSLTNTNENTTTSAPILQQETSESPHTLETNKFVDNNRMITRSQQGIFKPNLCYANLHITSYFAAEPKTITSTMKHGR